MANIIYRINTTPTVPPSTTAKGTPLTNAEVDGNFKSLADAVAAAASNVAPSFTGTVTLAGTTTPVSLNGASGTSGQVLTSAGAGATPTWATPAATQTFAGTVTYSGTATPVSLNGSMGTAGQVLTSAGAGATPTWTTVSASGGGQFFGNAATKAIAYNANSIAENVTITAGNNGLSAGPVTIADTLAVTIADTATWVIV
jgi:hypothetical protein